MGRVKESSFKCYMCGKREWLKNGVVGRTQDGSKSDEMYCQECADELEEKIFNVREE